MKRVVSVLMMLMVLVSMVGAVQGAYAAELNQVINAGGTTVKEAADVNDYRLEISKTIEAVEGKENFFDITLTANSNKRTQDTSTDVIVVLDISNTMNEADTGGNKKLDSAKAAIEVFLNSYAVASELAPRRFGLVTFNTNAEKVVDLTTLASKADASRIYEEKIDGIGAPDHITNKYTNIEGGLQLAHNMLKTSEAKYQYIILLTDGLPTTYVKSGADSTSQVDGYINRMDRSLDAYKGAYKSAYSNTDGYFAHTVDKVPCSYGADYSNKGAQKAKTVAQTIKGDGINIFSVGVGIGTKTIDDYLKDHKGNSFSTVDTTGMSASDVNAGNYEIGSASSSDSYAEWLKDEIAGGLLISGSATRYLSADNREQFQANAQSILAEIKIAPRTQLREFYALDPMGENIEFLHFFDKDGNAAANPNSLEGQSKQGAENTAVYGGSDNADRINWNLLQSGFTLDSEGKYNFSLTYRVRLENENAGYQTAADQPTNGDTPLHYSAKYVSGDDVPGGSGSLDYKIPVVEGYHGSLRFIKQDEETKKPLSGVEFTLYHYGDSCSVCGGEAPIIPITATTNGDGVLEMTRIPSGHQYMLVETGEPNGYAPYGNRPVIVSYAKTYIDAKTDENLLENGKFVNQSGDPDFIIYNDRAEPVELQVELTKTLEGREMTPGEFSFKMEGTGQHNTPYSVIAGNDANGRVTFSRMLFNEPGTYTFTITEVPGEDGSVVYDDAKHTVKIEVEPVHDSHDGIAHEHYVANVSINGGSPTQYVGTENVVDTISLDNAFTNSVRQPAKIRLAANKVLLDTDRNAINTPAGAFSFTLRDADGEVIDTAQNAADGSVSFAELTFNTPGTYTYTISEVTGEKPEYVYDRREYTATVTVSAPADLTDGGALSASVAYSLDGTAAEQAQFTNGVRRPAEFTLTAYKKLAGGTLKADAYEFELLDKQQNVIDAAKNDVSGKIVFDALTFDRIGEYHYTLREKTDDREGILFEESYYSIVVTVNSDPLSNYGVGVMISKTDASGQTTPVTYGNGASVAIELTDAFTNTVIKDGSAVLEARKVIVDVNGNALAPIADKFFFELLDEEGDTLQTVAAGADGRAAFDPIAYDRTGEYVYTIREVADNGDPNYAYDKNEYTATVTVTRPQSGSDTYVVETAYSLNGAAVNEAVFTNEHLAGSLEVSKTVVSSVESDHEKEFTFTVTLDDRSITGTYGGMTFNGGVASFALRDTEKMMATDLPAGVIYTVQEKHEDHFVTTYTGETGTISPNANATAAFTNTREKGDLVVRKIVNGGVNGDYTKKFAFTVTLDDRSITGTYGGTTFTDGVAVFELAHDESHTITGLPVGIQYTVAEMKDDLFTTTYTGEIGTISTVQSEVTVTNTRVRDGSLTVQKTVVSDLEEDAQKEFVFTIVLSAQVNGEFSGVMFKDGAATIKLKHGDSKTIEGLPTGLEYTVTETEDNGFTTESEGAAGRIPTQGGATASFRNTRKTTGFAVSKTVEVGMNGDFTKKFTFTITLEPALSGTFGGVTFTNGVTTFELAHNESKTFTGLPVGIGYTVMEKREENFATKVNGVTAPSGDPAFKSVLDEDAEKNKVAFINSRLISDDPLVISKTVVSPFISDSQRVFEFQIDLSNPTVSGTFKTIDETEAAGEILFTDGKASTRLIHGESIRITGLPAGVTATVTETPVDGFMTQVNGSTANELTQTLTDGGIGFAFVNTRPGSSKLTVSKTVEGTAADPQDLFTFEVRIEDLVDGVYGDMTFDGGVAVFQLRHGQKAVASGLPAGIKYTVTEIDCGSYTPAVAAFEGTIPAQGAEAAFVNTLNKPQLPQTGDHSLPMTFLLAMLLTSICGIGVLAKKRTN